MALGKGDGPVTTTAPAPAPAPAPKTVHFAAMPMPAPPAPVQPKSVAAMPLAASLAPMSSPAGYVAPSKPQPQVNAMATPVKAYTSLKAAQAMPAILPPPAHPAITPAAHAVLTAQAVTPKAAPIPRQYSGLQATKMANDAAFNQWFAAHAKAGSPDPGSSAAASQTASTNFGSYTPDLSGGGSGGPAPSPGSGGAGGAAAGMSIDSSGAPLPGHDYGSEGMTAGGVATVSQEEIAHYYVTYYNGMLKIAP